MGERRGGGMVGEREKGRGTGRVGERREGVGQYMYSTHAVSYGSIHVHMTVFHTAWETNMYQNTCIIYYACRPIEYITYMQVE